MAISTPRADAIRSVQIKICRQNRGFWKEEFEKRKDPIGHDYFWLTGVYHNTEPESTDTDEWAIQNNYVTIVPVQIKMKNNNKLGTTHKLIKFESA